MHLRNSCTRSTSACCMRQVPSGASGFRGANGWIFFFTRKFQLTSVTRSRTCGNVRIGSTVTGLVEVELVEPRHAHEARLAVDLRRARAALARLAVPADGQVVGLVGLDAVHGVEHDHALADLGRVVAAARRRPAPRARSGTWQRSLLLLLDGLLQVGRHGRDRSRA